MVFLYMFTTFHYESSFGVNQINRVHLVLLEQSPEAKCIRLMKPNFKHKCQESCCSINVENKISCLFFRLQFALSSELEHVLELAELQALLPIVLRPCGNLKILTDT